LGGFVLAAIYGLPHPTNDMDYIEIMPRDKELELIDVAGPESKLAETAVSQYPYEFESRLETLDLT
jgi:hypothetical protein